MIGGQACDPAIAPAKPPKTRTLLSRALGNTIGPLELMFNRRASSQPGSLLKSRGDEAVREENLQEVIERAVASHNVTRDAATAAAAGRLP